MPFDGFYLQSNTTVYTVLKRKYCHREHKAWSKYLDPKLTLSSKIWIPVCCLFSFPTEVVGRSWLKISSKFILCDNICNSHDHSVLQSIDITRRNLMLITLGAWRVKWIVKILLVKALMQWHNTFCTETTIWVILYPKTMLKIKCCGDNWLCLPFFQACSRNS